MTGPQPRRRAAAWTNAAPDHEGALTAADRVFVTAHPAEPTTSVLMRAGAAALTSYVDGGAPRVAIDPLYRLFARHLGERLPDDRAGTLHAAVMAAAVTAALDLALTEWHAAGATADGAAACRERFRSVAPLLPPEP